MAITQYSEYGSISSDIQNIVANKVKILDSYILFRTDEYEYTALIKDNVTQECTEYTFSRSGTTYSNNWTVSEAAAEFEYTVRNEYYVYSNVGLGRSLTLPVYEGVIAHSTIIMCCALLLWIVFKEVLFKWSFGKKKGW